MVDSDPRPGRYLLTGSTNFLTVPTISESLAGRVDIVTLWPLSMGELTGGSDGFVDRAFEGPAALAGHDGRTPSRREYLELVCRGGYPSVQAMGERDGRVVGVEVKASTTPRPEDFRWLRMLRDRLDRLGDQFVCGVVLHTGEHRVPFGDRLVAVPLADLWT